MTLKVNDNQHGRLS